MKTAHHDPVARTIAAGALLVSTAALVFSMSGFGQAGGVAAQSARPARAAVAKVRTNAAKRVPARVTVAARAKKKPVVAKRKKTTTVKKAPQIVATAKYAQNAGKLGGKTLAALSDGCPAGTVSIGTWCIDADLYSVPGQDAGKNNYFYATQACEKLGGYLPSAGQLIGAAPIIALASTLTDNPGTSITDAPVAGQPEPDTGYHDMREMSSTLFTTGAGDDAAGSEGVSVGSTGDPLLGQPNPTPEPSDPDPSTLDYVTVYDNGNKGGFAGGEWVGNAENFRCAYNKVQNSTRYGEG